MAQQYGAGGSITVKMEGPFGGGGEGGVSARIDSITLPANAWKGGESPFSQVVELDSVSIRSQVNLQLSAEQNESAARYGIAFTSINNDGEITVYALGNKPVEDFTIQATIMEVLA